MPSVVIQKGDPDFTKKTAIVAVVDRWKETYPAEWALFVEGNKMARTGRFDEMAMDPTRTVALSVRIPKKLLMMIDVMLEGSGVAIEKDDKLWKWFKESFPVFCIAKPGAVTKKFL